MFEKSDSPARTKVIFSSDARKALFKGLEITAEAVSCTLGPKGKTVLIQSGETAPIVTKDGVTVSKAVKLKDPVARMGAQLIKEAASQTNDLAGDGTTTATVLTHAMVKSGLKLLEAGYSSKQLCEGIDRATSTVSSMLREASKQLTTSDEIAQIATVSANGDETIGNLIAEAMGKVGHDGIVTVEEAKGMNTVMDVVEGMQFDRGYLSPYFVNNSEKMHAVYSEAKVLLADHKLSSMRDLIPVLEKIAQNRTPLLIIADDVEGEALQALVLNKVNGNLPVVAIKAPGYGSHKEELLRDIAALTGAKISSSSTGSKVTQFTLSDLGSLKRFVVDAKTTTLVASGASKDAVAKHVQDLKTQLQDITLTYDEIAKLKTRIAKLSNGVALIKVGGATEMEMIERKHRIEDALHATRAAMEEGIVPGGGTALFRIWHNLSKEVKDVAVDPGESIVLDACLAPIRRITANAGVSADVVVNELSRPKTIGGLLMEPGEFGYNAADGSYNDMVKIGVIDPAKVTRTALKNAASVAMTFLSLDAVVVEDEDN